MGKSAKNVKSQVDLLHIVAFVRFSRQFTIWKMSKDEKMLAEENCCTIERTQHKKFLQRPKKTYNHSTRARHLRFFNFMYFLEGLKGFRGSSKLCPSINHVSLILTFSPLWLIIACYGVTTLVIIFDLYLYKGQLGLPVNHEKVSVMFSI